MTTHHVTSDFPTGTTGTVVFRRKEWLFSESEGMIPPQEVTATITSDSIDQVLRATEETGVSPSFQYEVDINITGANQMRGFMELTADSVLGEVFNWTTPPNPDIFVTKAEFEQLSEALGDPVSRTEFDALSDDVDTVTAGLASEITNRGADVDAEQAARIADVDAEETRALAAEGVLDGRVDDLEALGLPDPVGAADGKVVKVLDDAYVLGDDETGGGGGGAGILANLWYDPVGALNKTASSTTYTVLDSTNALIPTFDAPASGSVLVVFECRGYGVSGDTALWVALLQQSGGAEVVDAVAATAVSDANTNRCTCTFRVDGLTPGAPQTWMPAIRSAYNGSGTVGARFGGGGDPLVVTVYELP